HRRETLLAALRQTGQGEPNDGSFARLGCVVGSAAFHHTPGTKRKRTRCAYAAYPGSSACNVRSSQTVRSTSNSEPKPAGINAHQEPSDNAMPTKRRTAAK